MEQERRNPTVCIAVLPFENISDLPDDDYFSRGFVDDLITDLAHFHSLQVISSYTSRKIGAKGREAEEAARELAIDYLLRGSLRRRPEHVRITTRLVAAADGRVVWAERYDAPLETIFEIQDEIVERVVGSISARIDRTLLTAARKKPLTSLAAYDCWLRGMDRMQRGTPEADREARNIFRQALDIDPNYARAWAGISLSHFNDWSCQIWDRWEETERLAYDSAVQANRLDDSDHVVQMILGRILLYRKQYDRAEEHLERSLSLNANCPAQIATSKTFLGKAEEGEALYRKALRLNPYRTVWYYPYGAFTYFVQRRYEPFIETARKGPLTDVWIDIPAFLAAACAYTERTEEAGRYLRMFLDVFAEKIGHGKRPEADEVISDGGLETTLLFTQGHDLPEFAAFDLLSRPGGYETLRDYFTPYLRLARERRIEFVLESPTWRASRDWGIRLGYTARELREINRKSVALLGDIRRNHGNGDTHLVISGCIGPRGDGYVPGAAVTAQEAEAYHGEQIGTLSETEADLVTAFTLNTIEEAVGITRAAQHADIPVAIGFTVETDGRLPSGPELAEAVTAVDRETGRALPIQGVLREELERLPFE